VDILENTTILLLYPTNSVKFSFALIHIHVIFFLVFHMIYAKFY